MHNLAASENVVLEEKSTRPYRAQIGGDQTMPGTFPCVSTTVGLSQRCRLKVTPFLKEIVQTPVEDALNKGGFIFISSLKKNELEGVLG